MCGIAGILDRGSLLSPEVLKHHLQQMLDKIQHRGPDDRGEERLTQINGLSLHLGHQRLSVIDTSRAGHQPMSNDDSTVWISTNSEIYNFHDLKKELQLKYNFFSQSDTEVLLRSYEAWGLDCLEKLRGMFAFAIWDHKKSRLILARDRLGIKPLYYHSSKNILLFSSELRSILSTRLINTSLNSSGIFQFLSFGRLGSPQTILDQIFELPPGHFLIADKNGTQIKKYWDPFKNSDLYDPDIPVTQQINKVLEEAIRLRLVSDVPLGAFLSGGIDSSAIVTMMADNTSSPIRTLSVNFEEKLYDESKYSSQIAGELGTQHHEFNISDRDILKKLPFAIEAMDQPTIDGINTYIISEAARQKGLTVALSGLGGDELFAGYDSFYMIPRLHRINNIMSTLPFYLRKKLGFIISKLIPRSDKSTKLIHLLNGQTNGAHVYFLIRALFCEEEIATLFYDQSIKNALILENIENTQELLNSQNDLTPINLISYLELTQYTAPTLLRDTDIMSMAHGLEVRVPFLDHKLVELMFAVPSKLKIKKNFPKPLLVNSLKRKLPNSLVKRKKMGFTLPFENWMRGKLKTEIETVLLTPLENLSGHISEPGIKKVWADFLDKRCTWSRPWSLYVLKRWVDQNL